MTLSLGRPSTSGRIAIMPEKIRHELRLVLRRDRRAVLDHAVESLRPALRPEALLDGDLDAVAHHASHDQLPAWRLRNLHLLRVSGGGRAERRPQREATPHPPCRR